MTEQPEYPEPTVTVHDDSATVYIGGGASYALEPETHAYISTACQHGLHERCRLICKFCDAGCQCACHEASEPTRTEATCLS
jgi:hypothetical protein